MSDAINYFIKVNYKELKKIVELVPCVFLKGEKIIYFDNFSDENSYSICGGTFFRGKKSRSFFLKINKKTKVKNKGKTITLSKGWYWLKDAIYIKD